MATAATEGAASEDGVEVQALAAQHAGPENVLRADGYIFATPENLAAMSGLMKDFFDRCNYAALDRINGRPYAAMVCAAATDRTRCTRWSGSPPAVESSCRARADRVHATPRRPSASSRRSTSGRRSFRVAARSAPRWPHCSRSACSDPEVPCFGARGGPAGWKARRHGPGRAQVPLTAGVAVIRMLTAREFSDDPPSWRRTAARGWQGGFTVRCPALRRPAMSRPCQFGPASVSCLSRTAPSTPRAAFRVHPESSDSAQPPARLLRQRDGRVSSAAGVRPVRGVLQVLDDTVARPDGMELGVAVVARRADRHDGS